MEQNRIRELVSQLTLDEKASLCSGRDNWFTKSVERLGIPSIRLSDGPHGLRTQTGAVNSLAEESSVSAVCYPAACTTAASFDRTLVEKMGAELGREAQALGVNILLGPGINMKRSPLCGRNFEYFSEDPMVAGELGAAFVKGVQSEGVGTSLKHFFANSQEHRRMDVSSEVDERTMREIYLSAFETVIKKAKPWTVMASYNKVNGIYSTENKEYLTEILRKEWGFDGFVMSDWGATHDRAGAVEAGCALTMPGEPDTDMKIVEAVKTGRLQEERLDEVCEQLLQIVFRAVEQRREGMTFDYESGNALAEKIAEESMVLLKNEKNVLPLEEKTNVAFIGAFAEKNRYQGGGSSHINSERVTDALTAAQKMGLGITYAQGYLTENEMPDGDTGKTEEQLLTEAVETAKGAEKVVLFVGLTDQMESEGVDRRHLSLPESHNRLIEEVCRVNENVIVVLHNGAPVEMPWVDKPKAILEAYLGGQAAGEAVVRILYGKVNPSGHLAETFPKKISDNPSYLFYFGEGDKVYYSEGVYVGYRYYISKEMKTLFPFGHGMSYTTFAYDNLVLNRTEMADTDELTVSVTVTNTGNRAGKAVVQLYVNPPCQEVLRPIRELKEFEKIALAPGESREVRFSLTKRAFAHWSTEMKDWRVESGTYAIQICENAEQVLLETPVQIQATQPLRKIIYKPDMSMSDFSKAPAGKAFLNTHVGYMIRGMAEAGFLPKEALQAIEMLGGGMINLSAVEHLAERMGQSGGTGGISALLSQPVSMLNSFMPQEEKENLLKLIDKLNAEN